MSSRHDTALLNKSAVDPALEVALSWLYFFKRLDKASMTAR